MRISKLVLGLTVAIGGVVLLTIAQAKTQNIVEDQQDTYKIKQSANQELKNANAVIIEDDDGDGQ